MDVINIVGGGAKINNYKVNGKSMLDISCSLHKPKEKFITLCDYLQNIFEKYNLDILWDPVLYMLEN